MTDRTTPSDGAATRDAVVANLRAGAEAQRRALLERRRGARDVTRDRLAAELRDLALSATRYADALDHQVSTPVSSLVDCITKVGRAQADYFAESAAYRATLEALGDDR